MSKHRSLPPLEPLERRAALGLATVFALRMLGLFLILPVFSLYADTLEGVTPIKIGLAIGAYGLTQAVLQIPFGTLSDRIGRKPVIIGGLLLFALGSVVAAMATTIDGVILGRLLQGTGAIAAAIMALAADLTHENSRTRVMGMIGVSIGMAFIISLIMGPLLATQLGISGLFWITAVLALMGIVVIVFVVPTPDHCTLHRDAEPVPAMIGKALAEPNLLRLYGGVFTLHMMLTALFLVIPPQLRDSYALQAQSHWQVYLPVMLLAMGLMVPFIVIAEKQHKMKQMLLLGIVSLMSSLLLMGFLNLSIFTFAGVMVLFFAAFNLLEAIMPSWVSKVADAEMRGTAMGVFASSQFAGAFFGGLMGGWIHQHYDNAGVFIFAAIMALLWLLFAASLKPPRHLGNYLLPLTDGDLLDIEALKQRLLAVKGVATVHILTEDAIAYMKVDNEHFDSDELAQVAASEV